MTCSRGDNSTTEKATAEIADTVEEIGPYQRENATPSHTENITITSHKPIIRTLTSKENYVPPARARIASEET